MREKCFNWLEANTHPHFAEPIYLFSNIDFFFYAMHISYEYLHPVVSPHSLTAILFCIRNILLPINICTRKNVNQDTVIQLLW